MSPGSSFYRDFVQADILFRRPDNRETTNLSGEHIDLIGRCRTLLKRLGVRISRLNLAVHRLRKSQELLLLARRMTEDQKSRQFFVFL
jgi:hypothetical protein